MPRKHSSCSARGSSSPSRFHKASPRWLLPPRPPQGRRRCRLKATALATAAAKITATKPVTDASPSTSLCTRPTSPKSRRPNSVPAGWSVTSRVGKTTSAMREAITKETVTSPASRTRTSSRPGNSVAGLPAEALTRTGLPRCHLLHHHRMSSRLLRSHPLRCHLLGHHRMSMSLNSPRMWVSPSIRAGSTSRGLPDRSVGGAVGEALAPNDLPECRPAFCHGSGRGRVLAVSDRPDGRCSGAPVGSRRTSGRADERSAGSGRAERWTGRRAASRPVRQPRGRTGERSPAEWPGCCRSRPGPASSALS